MATEASNKVKFLLATKIIDFSNDSFRVALMASGFSFNKDTHTKWADVSASQLTAGSAYGYALATVTGATVLEDTTNDKCSVIWPNVQWTASGGSIGPTPGAIIYDATVTSTTTPSVSSPIIGYYDFGGDQTQVDGGTFVIVAPEVDLT